MRLKPLIVVAALIAIPLAFVPLGRVEHPLVSVLIDFAHFPLLALVTVASYVLLEGMRSRQWRLAAAAAIGGGVAVAIELVQPLVARTASRLDVRIGLLGVLAACAALELWHRRGWLRWLYALAIAAAITVALIPAYDAWLRTNKARYGIQVRFPQLADFEHPVALRRWRLRGTNEKLGSIALSTQWSSSGLRSLRVRTPGHAWHSLLHATAHHNWKRGRELRLDIFVTDTLRRVRIGLQDTAGAKFHRWLPVVRGDNRLHLPLPDVLDLTKMRFLSLAVPRGDDAHTFYIDNVRVAL